MARSSTSTLDYNARLFERPGLRSYLHNSRFHWFRKKVENLRLNTISAIEIGCFDGRLLEFLPQPPERFFGFDAGWEGGLAMAQRKYADHPHYKFIMANDASALTELDTHGFNLAVAMETIEHIQPERVDAYLRELARVTKGHFLLTVPNEKGAVFLSKWLTKKLLMGSAQPYKTREVLAATFGRMSNIERDEHKGFNYSALVSQISRYFDVVSVESLPVQKLPLWASFTIGIVARSKTR